MKNLLFTLLFAVPGLLFAQAPPKKRLQMVRFDQAPEIDGRLDESVWRSGALMKDFVMLEPANGPMERNGQKTRIRLGFTDQYIFVGASMSDPEPDSIHSQLTRRDNYGGNCDWFGIFINPFNDGLSDFNFWVTAAGVQADARTTAEGDDFNWNTVWKSAVAIHDSGWSVELAIPYQALRFSRNNPGDWGLQAFRYVRRTRELYSWNFIDRNVGIPEQQAGLLGGLHRVEPPLRLALLPYGSVYYNNYNGEDQVDYNLGMDVKYGLSESFTLDMTLIPDFGQVAFDEQFLNLSPFENQFQENRQFFTEGTDLFNKGGLFYSRRIGGAPKNISNAALGDSGYTQTTQDYTQLLNATKISGRTAGNLGIGVLNAITDNNYVTLTETATGESQRVLTDPLTNYNVLVLDQRFNGNSGISLINTNVWREGEFRDANATSLLLDLYTKDNAYNVRTQTSWSQLWETGPANNGYAVNWAVEKTRGRWRWEVSQNLYTNTYQINDLGFLARNNQLSHSVTGYYQNVQPFGIFNRVNTYLTWTLNHLHSPNAFESSTFYLSSFALTRNFFAGGLEAVGTPWITWDYFESRVKDRPLQKPTSAYVYVWFSSDYRHPFALDGGVSVETRPEWNSKAYSAELKPVVRLNDHLSFEWTTRVGWGSNQVGWAGMNGDSIRFAYRSLEEVLHSLDARYIFGPNSSLSLNLRHLTTRLDAKQTAFLQPDGRLGETTTTAPGTDDLQFSAWNVDLKFSWWFAPGSEMMVLYRNALIQGSDELDASYRAAVNRLFRTPQSHNISLRIVYFLDVHYLTKKTNA